MELGRVSLGLRLFRLNDGFTFSLEKSSVSIGVSVYSVSLGFLAVGDVLGVCFSVPFQVRGIFHV